MFRAFNLSSKYGHAKAENILLTYQTFAISVKVPTPYTTQPPCHNCVARLGEYCFTYSDWPMRTYSVVRGLITFCDFLRQRLNIGIYIYQGIQNMIFENHNVIAHVVFCLHVSCYCAVVNI